MTDGIHFLGNGDAYRGVFLSGTEEWSQFFEHCNWRTFHPIHFELEDDRIMGGIELSVIVLGFGFRLRWNYARTEDVDAITASVDEIMREHKLN